MALHLVDLDDGMNAIGQPLTLRGCVQPAESVDIRLSGGTPLNGLSAFVEPFKAPVADAFDMPVGELDMNAVATKYTGFAAG